MQTLPFYCKHNILYTMYILITMITPIFGSLHNASQKKRDDPNKTFDLYSVQWTLIIFTCPQ